MKKTLSVLFLSMVTLAGYSQDENADDDKEMPICIIVNGALNFTSMEKNDYFYSSKANAGFSGGAVIRTDGNLYVLGGFQYVSVNPTMTYKETSESEKINMQFFQVPLMVGYHLARSKDLTKCFHAQLGGSFSSLLQVSENSIGIDEDNLRKTGFTFKFGLGADLWKFVADINYNLLLTNVYDDAGYNNKAKLMCWEFSLGYKFNLGKKHKKDSDDN